MKVKDIIYSDLIKSGTSMVIREEESFRVVAEGERYDEEIVEHLDREVGAFTWQDDGLLYIDLK